MYCSTVSEKILACGTWKKKIAKGILELANARQSFNFLNRLMHVKALISWILIHPWCHAVWSYVLTNLGDLAEK
jgi:hypothetical protein